MIRLTSPLFPSLLGLVLAMPPAAAGQAAPPELARMFRVPGLPENPAAIVWENLPQVQSARIRVFRGEEGVSGFNHHPCLIHFDGRFFAGWNTGARDEDATGQRVLYSTSADGASWGAPVELTGRREGRRCTAAGFWLRDGTLWALASLRPARDGPPTGDDNPLFGFRWSPAAGRFEPPVVLAANFFPNNVPQRAPDGAWLMLGKAAGSGAARMLAAKGGVRALDDWRITTLPNDVGMEEAEWYSVGGDALLAQFRERGRDVFRMVRMHSPDAGETWSRPVLTDFPEAASRHHGLRLGDGGYALFLNPRPTGYRVPLSVALSRDGLIYDRIANVRMEQTNRRHSGHAKAPGYQYVRALEHGGHLWVIYSVNKEDIEISRVPTAELARLRALGGADYARGQLARPEIVIDNTDARFSTDSAWRLGTAAAGYHGRDYAFVEDPGRDARRWARWSFVPGESGSYHAYLRWSTIGFSSRSPMADIVPVEVQTRVLDRRTVDQTRYGGTWIHLGTYELVAGEAAAVTVRAPAHGITVADAVKFVRAPAHAP